MLTGSKKGMKTFKIYLEERVDLQIYVEDNLDKHVEVQSGAITISTNCYRGEAVAKYLKEALNGFIEIVKDEPTKTTIVIDPIFRAEIHGGLISIIRKPIVRMDEKGE